MSKVSREIVQKEDVIQAVVIADNFGNDFLPICNDIPLALLPIVNKSLIEYTLQFLSLGGIEETFLFCCTHVDAIKKYIRKCTEENAVWSQTMVVNIIVSESCQSFGDCLRDLDAKGLVRGHFVLCEAGAIGNIKLLPIIKKHNEVTNKDKGAAMTLIYEEGGIGQYGRCPTEEILIASNSDNRILFHKKIGQIEERKIDFPLEIFLENSTVSIQHNLKDTHIAICSPVVLPLFADNFDFQTRNDFIKGLLINEEILGSTIYWQLIKGNQHGGAVTNWRMYQAISRELITRWFYPVIPSIRKASFGQDVVVGHKSIVGENSNIIQSVIGDNVRIGKNVYIDYSYIMSDVEIRDNCVISHSIIGPKCTLNKQCKVTIGSVLSKGVYLPKDSVVENSLIQATKPTIFDSKDVLSEKAYKLTLTDDDGEIHDVVGCPLVKRFSKLHLDDGYKKSDDEDIESSDNDEGLSHVNSPIPDDTNMFFNEVIDSLTRGFEDKLQCDNLILEINSSRYAYNVTLKEVNFNVVRAILNLPFQQSTGQPYWLILRNLLVYFSPILKNYIRNENAMDDCLQAINDVAVSNNELCECSAKVLNWFYNQDLISEESVFKWYKCIDKKSRVYARLEPFVNWLQEAEEASSSEESN